VFRLTLLVVAVSSIPLGLGVAIAWDADRTQRASSAAMAAHAASIRSAEELAIGARDIRSELQLFLITNERSHLDAIPPLREEIERWLIETEKLSTTADGSKWIKRVESGYQHFCREIDQIAGPPVVADARARISNLLKEVLDNEILHPAQTYLDITEDEINRQSAENQRVASRTANTFLLIGTCGPIVGLLTGYWIARHVSRSIVRLSVPVLDAAGKLAGVVGPITLSARWGWEELEAALRTIAERIGAVVEHLHQSKLEALRAEQLAAVGQLAVGFAHELRNAVMPMKILIQAAATRTPSPTLDGPDLAVVEQEIMRLEKSVQALLDFARPARPDKHPFDLRKIVQETISLLKPRAVRQGVNLECRCPEEPVTVNADIGQIRQILLNLLLNSLDAVPHGGFARICVLSHAAGPEKNGNWVGMRVEDNGRGLPGELGDRIFEPFVTTKDLGVGLGLSICKRIAEAHGGRISACNLPGGGASFLVLLPV
jgi:signal transduction histidine kinase